MKHLKNYQAIRSHNLAHIGPPSGRTTNPKILGPATASDRPDHPLRLCFSSFKIYIMTSIFFLVLQILLLTLKTG